MDLQTIITSVLSPVVSIGTLAWVIWERKKSGVSDVQDDVTKYYKERRTQQDERIKEQDIRILALNETIVQNDKRCAEEIAKIDSKISFFEAAIIEKDKYIKSLTDLIQGRNPEMIDILNSIKEILRKNMDLITIMHEQNKKVLNYQTDMLEQNQAFIEKNGGSGGRVV